MTITEVSTKSLITKAAHQIRRPDDNATAEKIKDFIFEHDFVSQCSEELNDAKFFNKNLDTSSFIMGFVAGAKVAAILLEIRLKPESKN